MGRLDGRLAVVTGAARGLGAGIAAAFGREGATVVCADVRDASEIASSIPAGKALRLDVTDATAVDVAFSRIVDRHGRIDILANNAGILQPMGDVVDLDPSVIDRVFAVNVVGVINCSRAAVRHMKQERYGRIINTASQVGKEAWPGWGIYCASKFAVIGLTQAMALELASHGITVNAICPGTMATDMMPEGLGQIAASKGLDFDTMVAKTAASIPLGRMGKPEDMGNMAVFLASDESSYTTGAQFNLTGGDAVWF
jgi:NAD(P)-dependent dehydrogenase (short-subunit alcohol dehydrogenase family)